VEGDTRLQQNGYRVIPAALRNAQKTYEITAERWTTLHGNVLSWTLADDDLGLIGRQAGVIAQYNQAVNTIADKLRDGSESLRSAGEALDQIAAAYEAQDEKYYAEFGWTDKQLDGVAPPPD
jgi:hypothetical protein